MSYLLILLLLIPNVASACEELKYPYKDCENLERCSYMMNKCEKQGLVDCQNHYTIRVINLKIDEISKKMDK